jgi:hypothetical protein
MTDEMMHAQMAAAYAAQRAELVKQQDNHLQQLLPPDLVSFLQHYMQSREYTARQALSVILYQFFGSCSKSQQLATLPPTLNSKPLVTVK